MPAKSREYILCTLLILEALVLFSVPSCVALLEPGLTVRSLEQPEVCQALHESFIHLLTIFFSSHRRNIDITHA